LVNPDKHDQLLPGKSVTELLPFVSPPTDNENNGKPAFLKSGFAFIPNNCCLPSPLSQQEQPPGSCPFQGAAECSYLPGRGKNRRFGTTNNQTAINREDRNRKIPDLK